MSEATTEKKPRDLEPVLVLTPIDDTTYKVAEKQPPAEVRTAYDLDRWLAKEFTGGKFMPVRVIFRRAYEPKKVEPKFVGKEF